MRRLSRRLGDQVFGSLLMDYLGWIPRHRGEHSRALALHQENLRSRWTVQDRKGAAITLGYLAETALCLGRHEDAAILFGAQRSWQSAGAVALPIPCSTTLDRRAAMSRLESVLAPGDREAAYLQGRLMQPAGVVTYALRMD